MEEHICIQKPNSQNDQIIKNWEYLCSDITEKIISYLPIRSIVIASSVCKIWNSIITSNSFTTKISGGVRFVGGLVDVEDRLAVEIYNPTLDSWELCQPLPADFRSGNSSQWLCSALLKGKKFYVFGIYSCFVTCFNLDEHLWSEVQTLRPPGILFSFLMTCQDCLVLGGLCNSPNGINFIIWKVDEETMEFSEIAIMPHELMYCLFDSDEDDKFASLKCVGLGNLIYVYNEEHHKNYPACVCEFSNEFGKFSWRKLPNLPAPASKFHRVISFCSNVSLDNILVGARI
ncbi:F-box/kelch-repeat protein At3g24760 isoform X2 [Lycium barbarum]|uniref:F-box/kelch-repeat protein At3g24760 isoform X2 n=1 Tax=Lycium barbarum TaxID=112863 RepID=UPI00293E95FA|nr:F-box/kelch-repeat protein At3g24760 isoform X2 [Lycium barbarum]